MIRRIKANPVAALSCTATSLFLSYYSVYLMFRHGNVWWASALSLVGILMVFACLGWLLSLIFGYIAPTCVKCGKEFITLDYLACPSLWYNRYCDDCKNYGIFSPNEKD